MLKESVHNNNNKLLLKSNSIIALPNINQKSKLLNYISALI